MLWLGSLYSDFLWEWGVGCFMGTSVHGNMALSWDKRVVGRIEHVMLTIHPIIDVQEHKLIIMI